MYDEELLSFPFPEGSSIQNKLKQTAANSEILYDHAKKKKGGGGRGAARFKISINKLQPLVKYCMITPKKWLAGVVVNLFNFMVKMRITVCASEIHGKLSSLLIIKLVPFQKDKF